MANQVSLPETRLVRPTSGLNGVNQKTRNVRETNGTALHQRGTGMEQDHSEV
jgi:hypothetical protein